MNGRPVLTEGNRSPGKLILPALVISRFATQPPGLLVGLLLVEIGLAFGTSVGVAGQIRSVSYFVSVIFALFMGVLSVRFKHKSLLVIGLLSLSLSALGCGFAPSFDTMLVTYAVSGLGMAMVAPMCLTLVGEHFPREKRPGAIGWIFGGTATAYVVGSPTIALIAGLGGWRLAFLGFVLPVALFSLLLAIKGVPPAFSSQQTAMSLRDYLGGFSGVFSNRSADACLAGTALSMATWMGILTYSASFFRQRFLISVGSASIVLLVAALSYTSGSVISGRFVKRFGRKLLTVLAALFAGVFTLSYANLPDLWLSMTAVFLGSFFAGMRVTASNSLTLEQVPKFRGTMMSISTAADNAGSSLGTAIGGLALILFNYEAMAISLGVLGIASAIVFFLLAIDPTAIDLSRGS
jgi:DHA1 family inner membrane transport protein